ncbi:MAG: Ig-like domain-containing protein [Alistipes sp.]|jgi:hypothetical protein|nr:Ig-like domain-containing protein [Alistipes sp.]
MKKALTFLLAGLLAVAMCAACGDNPEQRADNPEPEPEPVPVEGVTVTSENVTIDLGGTTTLTATVNPTGATNKNITWSSEDDTIATVDPKTGLVTAVDRGEVTITVTTEEGDFTDDCIVTVNVPMNGERGYRFVGASGFYDFEWNQLEVDGSFMIFLMGYERSADTNPMGAGYMMFLRIFSRRMDLTQPLVELPEGEYPFSLQMDWETVFLGEDPARDMISGIEWQAPGKMGQTRLLKSGTLKVTGGADGADYTLELDLTFQNDSQMSAFYDGPMMILHPEILTTLTGNVDQTLNHGVLRHLGVLHYADVHTWSVRLFGEGVSLDEDGFVQGTGHYVDLEVNALNGVDFPAGSYIFEREILESFKEGTATSGHLIPDRLTPNNGRRGSWYYEIVDGKIVHVAPLVSGTVTIGELDGDNATCTIDGSDSKGNTIALDFDGAIEIVE